MNEFKEFGKIPRLYRDVIITEKIDGTNAAVIVPEGTEEPLQAQSRSRLITPQDDNYGFARWVQENEKFLRDTLGPGHHFGEWWGIGIQKRYSESLKKLTNPSKYFSLFNVSRWSADSTPAPLQVVPTLYTGPFTESAIQNALKQLRENGSVACPGSIAEGIVVFHVASGHLYKVTLEKDSEWKGKDTAK
jgi:hypothetical protein